MDAYSEFFVAITTIFTIFFLSVFILVFPGKVESNSKRFGISLAILFLGIILSILLEKAGSKFKPLDYIGGFIRMFSCLISSTIMVIIPISLLSRAFREIKTALSKAVRMKMFQHSRRLRRRQQWGM